MHAGVIDYDVPISAGELATEMIKEYDYISIAEYDHLLEPGHPALPAKFLSFVIPPDAQFEHLEVLRSDGAYLPGEYRILPAQKPVPTMVDHQVEFTQPDQSVYSLNTLYPQTTVRFVHEGNLSGYQIVTVMVTPLRYNPTAKQLYLTSNLRFRIHYQQGAVPAKMVTETQKQHADDRVRELVVNDHQVSSFSPPSDMNRGQMRKGVPAEIVTTSEIYASYPDGDNPRKIRDFITDAVNAGALYILLGGQCDFENNEEIVARRDVWVCSTSYTYWDDIDTIPCDLYYSDLDGTWDGNGNGTYGEMEDGVDLYSNVYVGRAPVKNISQIENFVTKVISYETGPSLAYVEKALLVVGNLFPGNQGNHGTGMNDTIANAIPDDWQKSKLYEDYGLISRYIVRDSIDQGFHMASMVGHGNQFGIYYTGNN
jgi:hypothetical protein